MPNYVTTYININSEDKEALERLCINLEEWTSKNYAENDFGTSWLGNIVLGAEIGTINTNEETDLKARGKVSYLDFVPEEGSIMINTETAWVPMLKIWKKLVDKYAPGAEILYCVYLGDGELYTNDPTKEGQYEIDPCGFERNDIEVVYTPDATEEDIVSLLKKIFETDDGDMNKLMEMFNNSSFKNDTLFITKYKMKELDEWD